MTSGSPRTITDTSTASSSAKSMLSRAFHRTLPVSDAFAEARTVSKHKGPELTPNSSLDSTASCSSWGWSSNSPISVTLPKKKKKNHSVRQYPAKCINVVVTGVSALSIKWLPWQEDGDPEEYEFRSVDMSALALRRVPARVPGTAAEDSSSLSLRRVFHLRRRRTASALEPTHMPMGPPLPDSTHLAPTPSRPHHHLDTLESPPSHESRAIRFALPPGMVLPPSGASGSGEEKRD